MGVKLEIVEGMAEVDVEGIKDERSGVSLLGLVLAGAISIAKGCVFMSESGTRACWALKSNLYLDLHCKSEQNSSSQTETVMRGTVKERVSQT